MDILAPFLTVDRMNANDIPASVDFGDVNFAADFTGSGGALEFELFSSDQQDELFPTSRALAIETSLQRS